MEGFGAIAAMADFLWSFLPRTADFCSAKHPVSELVPIAHVAHPPPELRRAPKDIDVLFFGRITPHRIAILSALIGAGLRVVVAGSGTALEWQPPYIIKSLMDRAKIGLNLCLHGIEEAEDGVDPRFASGMRITEMLERDLCVLSEEIPLDNPYASYMVSRPAEDLVEECRNLLVSGQWRELGRSASARYRAEFDARQVCAPAIARTLARIGAA